MAALARARWAREQIAMAWRLLFAAKPSRSQTECPTTDMSALLMGGAAELT
jgi:hypothetical protein